MKIDQKYFNVFLMIVALVAAILIAVFMLKNRSNEKEAFEKRMISAQDTLDTVYWTEIQKEDSLQIADFKNKYVILDFWANWSGATEQSHHQLMKLKRVFPDTLEVIAAAVGLTKKEAVSYMEKHTYPFHFVAGSKQFKDLGVPGLPAQVIFHPSGAVHSTFLGFQGEARYDSLRAIITNERE